MPYSSDESTETVRAWLSEWVRTDADSARARVLDIGAGAGWNLSRYKDVFTTSGSHWTAVEIWGPYVSRFALHDHYDEVIVADARSAPTDPAEWGDPQVILLGDVLEHLVPRDAVALWEWSRDAVGEFGLVIATLPIVHYPQGAEEGNPHEEHLYHWSSDEFWRVFPGVVESHDGDVTGAFLAYGTQDAR